MKAKYLSVKEAMFVLGVTERTIRKYLKNGKLTPAFREQGTDKIYFDAKAVFDLRTKMRRTNSYGKKY